MNNKDYDDTYKEALKTNDPRGYTIKKWGDPKPYFQQFIEPILLGKSNLNTVEIGAGMGRYTELVKPYAKMIYAIESSLLCLPVLSQTKITAVHTSEVDTIPNGIDLVYTFSTMLHFTLYEIWFYLNKLCPKVSPDGWFVLHYSSFDSNGGADYFIKTAPKEFGETGRYCFHNSKELIKLFQHFFFDIILDSEPTKPIIPGHRVLTMRRRNKI